MLVIGLARAPLDIWPAEWMLMAYWLGMALNPRRGAACGQAKAFFYFGAQQ